MVLFYENSRMCASFNMECVVDLLRHEEFFDTKSKKEESYYNFGDELTRNNSNDGQHRLHPQVDYKIFE